MIRTASPECSKPERMVLKKDQRKKTQEVEDNVHRGLDSHKMHSWYGNDNSTQSGDTELNL